MSLTEEKAVEMQRILDEKAKADEDFIEATRLSNHSFTDVYKGTFEKKEGKNFLYLYNTGVETPYAYIFNDDGTLEEALSFAVTKTISDVSAKRTQLDADFDALNS